MKLYMNVLSPNVRRVRLTAAVLGIALDEVNLDFAKGEHKAPAYLKLNPNGAIPTLVDDDFVLTESRAIMQYLAQKRPESGLFPEGDHARAEISRWQFWDAAHFAPALGTLIFEKLIKPMMGAGEPDARKVDEAMGNFLRFGEVLNQRLDGARFVVGNSLTVADLTIACSLMYAKETDAPVSRFPNIEDWRGRMTSLEAWKKTDPSHHA